MYSHTSARIFWPGIHRRKPLVKDSKNLLEPGPESNAPAPLHEDSTQPIEETVWDHGGRINIPS